MWSEEAREQKRNERKDDETEDKNRLNEFKKKEEKFLFFTMSQV